jgi:hypothetical protein
VLLEYPTMSDGQDSEKPIKVASLSMPSALWCIYLYIHTMDSLEISRGILAAGLSKNNSANKWAKRQRTVTIRHVQLHQFTGLQCKHADLNSRSVQHSNYNGLEVNERL